MSRGPAEVMKLLRDWAEDEDFGIFSGYVLFTDPKSARSESKLAKSRSKGKGANFLAIIFDLSM